MTDDDAAMKPARLPRGVKPVARAFFTALDTVPDASRTAVAKAAQAMIRDQLKLRRDKLREAAAKEKARRPAAAKPSPAKVGKPAAPTKPKRRARKQTYTAAAA